MVIHEVYQPSCLIKEIDTLFGPHSTICFTQEDKFFLGFSNYDGTNKRNKNTHHCLVVKEDFCSFHLLKGGGNIVYEAWLFVTTVEGKLFHLVYFLFHV